MFKHSISIGMVSMAALLCASPAMAAPPSMSGASVTGNPEGSAQNVTLTVSGPNGFSATDFSAFSKPSLSLSDGGPLADGVYTWNMTSMSQEKILNPKRNFNNGRGGNEKEFVNKSVSESGSFRVLGGVILQADGLKVEPSSNGQEGIQK